MFISLNAIINRIVSFLSKIDYSLLEGRKIPTQETIKFLRTENGYKVDCNDYIKNYEQTVDKLVEQDMAAGFHFYYECVNGQEVYFQKLES